MVEVHHLYMWELVHGQERLLIVLGTSQHRGTQRKILRKRPKYNNKAWIKLSEAILRILGDFWEEFKCFPRPTPSKTEGRVPRQQSVPATCNLTYRELFQQTHLQTLLVTLGVIQGQN